VISEDFAFFGFDAKSWDRLVSLFLGEDGDRPRGVLVLVIDANRIPVASFHTARGSIDPATLPSADTLEALCHATNAGACIVMRQRGIADVEAYLADPLDPDQDFASSGTGTGRAFGRTPFPTCCFPLRLQQSQPWISCFPTDATWCSVSSKTASSGRGRCSGGAGVASTSLLARAPSQTGRDHWAATGGAIIVC
jgi:hypothetical protein